jgi:hypothetical protein
MNLPFLAVISAADVQTKKTTAAMLLMEEIN